MYLQIVLALYALLPKMLLTLISTKQSKAKESQAWSFMPEVFEVYGCISGAGREHELFGRYIQTNTKINGSRYFKKLSCAIPHSMLN